jgi:hypothetical protein
MAKYCSCGKKIGFFNKGYKCKNCGKDLCMKCHEWMIYDDIPLKRRGSSEIDLHVCSNNCAIIYTNNKIESFNKNKNYLLLNLNNSMVSIEELGKKIGTHPNYSIAYMKGEPQNVEDQPMPKFMQKVYDQVKSKMQSRGLQFKEESRTEY